MTHLHLVGHDATVRGDDALALARMLRAGRDVQRLVVHVLPIGGPTYEVTDSWIAAQPADVGERLDRVRSSLHADEELELVFAESVARGLHDRAEEHEADLVVVGARARHPFERPIGTVAERLLSGGPCAVAHAPVGFAAEAHAVERIVVGFDGSAEAHDAVAEAAALALGANAVVDLLYAHDPPSRLLGTPGAVSITPDEVHEADRKADELAREGLETLPEAVRGVAVGRSGAAGPALEAFATQQDADLIVVGSRGYGPIRRALLGSTGIHVLHRTDRAVLVVPRAAHATLQAEAPSLAAVR